MHTIHFRINFFVPWICAGVGRFNSIHSMRHKYRLESYYVKVEACASLTLETRDV